MKFGKYSEFYFQYLHTWFSSVNRFGYIWLKTVLELYKRDLNLTHLVFGLRVCLCNNWSTNFNVVKMWERALIWIVLLRRWLSFILNFFCLQLSNLNNTFTFTYWNYMLMHNQRIFFQKMKDTFAFLTMVCGKNRITGIFKNYWNKILRNKVFNDEELRIFSWLK